MKSEEFATAPDYSLPAAVANSSLFILHSSLKIALHSSFFTLHSSFFVIAVSSFTLLNHDLFTIHNVETLSGLADAAALQVVHLTVTAVAYAHVVDTRCLA